MRNMVLDRKSSRRLAFLGSGILVFSFLSIIYAHYIGFFALNTESCIRGHYFYIDRLNKALRDGEYVAFRFKGDRLYPKGFRFIKIVGCTAGERLISKKTKRGYAFFCNGRLLGYACDPRKYRRCPRHKTYNMIIPKGYFYAQGTSWNAYDSRYWGLASIKSVIGVGYKLF